MLQRTTLTMHVVYAAAALILVSKQAVAQQLTPDMKACMSDYRRLCSGVSPGGGRVLACLQTRIAEVTAPCRAVIDKHAK